MPIAKKTSLLVYFSIVAVNFNNISVSWDDAEHYINDYASKTDNCESYK